MKKKVVIISPELRGWRGVVYVSILLVLGLGLSAYFIPNELFTHKVNEQHQKKIIAEQNELLTKKIATALPLLENLKDQVRLLDLKKENVKSITAKTSGKPESSNRNQDPIRKKPDPIKLAEKLLRDEPSILRFVELTKSGNPFQAIPVCWPVTDRNSIVSAPFGVIRDPFTGKNKWHYGVDFSAGKDVAVVATGSGIVTGTSNDRVWGLSLTIDHGNGYSSRYAHLGKVKTSSGRRVLRGDTIGVIGNSGITTGPHVHYEIRYKGKVIDPEKLLFPFQSPGKVMK